MVNLRLFAAIGGVNERPVSTTGFDAANGRFWRLRLLADHEARVIDPLLDPARSLGNRPFANYLPSVRSMG